MPAFLVTLAAKDVQLEMIFPQVVSNGKCYGILYKYYGS